MIRRTKIIITLGPATDDPVILEKTLAAGVDIVRVNFSHGTSQEQIRRIEMVRSLALKINREIAVLADLQGPKIRIAGFKAGKVQLNNGDSFVLDTKLASEAGDQHQVGVHYQQLPQDVKPGDVLLLNDGLIEMEVKSIIDSQVNCIVTTGGILSNNKGLNRFGGGLSATALTLKDKQDLITAVSCNVDYIAVSFPRNAQDIEYAISLIKQAKGTAGIIAKIERAEAVDALDDIIKVSDGIMIARGDLGVEIGDAELPAVQKHIIRQCRSLNKPVITATQMMESMIHSPLPTRAEVFDVANAVLDGTDAVMLSAETAAGENPPQVVAAMARICLGAEKTKIAQISKHRIDSHFEQVDEAIAMSSMYIANHLNIKAIITLTESGTTPLLMSRIRSGIPIYGLSRHQISLRRMTLYRGVYPLNFDLNDYPPAEVNRAAVNLLAKQHLVKSGDWVIITRGDLLGVHGKTNCLKIVEVDNVF